MPIYQTPDGRYTFFIETPGEGDGNSVVKDNVLDEFAWSRFGWEAAHGKTHLDPLPPPPRRPDAPSPSPTVGPPGSRVIRVSDEQDGELLNRGYSYWSQAVVIGERAFVFVGHADDHPRFFEVDLQTGAVTRLGPLVSYAGTGEGWYWDQARWLYLLDGPRLRRVNPFPGDSKDTIVFDISRTHPGCDLWQAHSSDDGQVHSATVRRIVSEGKYPYIGTVVWYRGDFLWYPSLGALDESAITANGEYLIIKDGIDNLIVTLASGEVRTITDAAGAVGHSDTGEDFVIGEDDQYGACVLWTLQQPMLRHTLFSTWNMGHVSVRGGRCLLSDATHLSLVALDGSGVTPLAEHGMVVPPGTPEWQAYDYQVEGNLDPTGHVAAFVSNKEGRFDLYLLVL